MSDAVHYHAGDSMTVLTRPNTGEGVRCILTRVTFHSAQCRHLVPSPVLPPDAYCWRCRFHRRISRNSRRLSLYKTRQGEMRHETRLERWWSMESGRRYATGKSWYIERHGSGSWPSKMHRYYRGDLSYWQDPTPTLDVIETMPSSNSGLENISRKECRIQERPRNIYTTRREPVHMHCDGLVRLIQRCNRPAAGWHVNKRRALCTVWGQSNSSFNRTWIQCIVQCACNTSSFHSWSHVQVNYRCTVNRHIICHLIFCKHNCILQL